MAKPYPSDDDIRAAVDRLAELCQVDRHPPSRDDAARFLRAIADALDPTRPTEGDDT